MRSLQRGFTLIEMITVVVLLGVISVGIGGLIKFGAQIFVDVNNRDDLVGSARFAIERLNREVRGALPNSVRVVGDGNSPQIRQCLEFIPAIASAVYQDVPVAPEAPTNSVPVIRFDRTDFSSNLFAVVYPLFPDDLYDGSATPKAISNLVETSTHVWTLTLASAGLFSQDSPTRRLYFVDYPVSYCVQAGKLTRHVKSDFADGQPTVSDTSVLMAENLEIKDVDDLSKNYFPFNVSAPTHLRNAILTSEIRFAKNDERITFNNETQVINVP
jgi:MSHA biogenesis protein MshO